MRHKRACRKLEMDQQKQCQSVPRTPAAIPSEELMQAQTEIWRLSYSFIKSMALGCAVKLGIPDAIHRSGGATTLTELLAAVPLAKTKRTHVSRLMRLLTELGVFLTENDHVQAATANGGGEAGAGVVYRLTPVSRLLVHDAEANGGACLSQFVAAVTALSSDDLTPYQRLDEWLKIEEAGDSSSSAETPFMMAYGQGFWAADGWDAERSMGFNERVMGSDSRLVAEVVVRECRDLFQGVTSLVDVGGGNGAMARAIVGAFPHVKCSVLELPQVLENAPRSTQDDTFQFVAGDMMDFIPPADVVLLKNVLHDWSDEDCVRILQRCREAINASSPAGKVVIIEMVVGQSSSTKEAFEAQLLMDMCMMVLFTGKERGEQPWNKIFMDSGFTRYKVRPVLGARSVIELYP